MCFRLHIEYYHIKSIPSLEDVKLQCVLSFYLLIIVVFFSEVLFGADYLLQFYISRNKLDFLFSLMAFVDVVTLFPILVFKLVCLGIQASNVFFPLKWWCIIVDVKQIKKKRQLRASVVVLNTIMACKRESAQNALTLHQIWDMGSDMPHILMKATLQRILAHWKGSMDRWLIL